MRGTFEKKPLAAQLKGFSPRIQNVIWHVLIIVLVSLSVVFSMLVLTRSNGPADVNVTCGQGDGSPCKP
jgi:hypothetical protein